MKKFWNFIKNNLVIIFLLLMIAWFVWQLIGNVGSITEFVRTQENGQQFSSFVSFTVNYVGLFLMLVFIGQELMSKGIEEAYTMSASSAFVTGALIAEFEDLVKRVQVLEDKCGIVHETKEDEKSKEAPSPDSESTETPTEKRVLEITVEVPEEKKDDEPATETEKKE